MPDEKQSSRKKRLHRNTICLVVRQLDDALRGLAVFRGATPAPRPSATPTRMKKKIYNDITETIGNTPLVRLNRTAAEHGAS